MCLALCFLTGETEAQRDQAICVRVHCWWVAELGFELDPELVHLTLTYE